MSDGRIHGVQIWLGPPDEEPPPRPVIGSLIWDLTQGTATDTPESLRIGGWDPDKETTQGRAFAEDLPRRALNPNEAEIISMVIKPEDGLTICNTWDVTDHQGERITVGFVARSVPEVQDEGGERLICRAMNWRSLREGPSIQEDLLGQRILDSLAEPGVYRALVDPRHWSLLKWLDEPVPFFDWRAGIVGERAHPDDQADAGRDECRVRDRGHLGCAADGRPSRRVDSCPRDGAPRRTRQGRLRRPGGVSAAHARRARHRGVRRA